MLLDRVLVQIAHTLHHERERESVREVSEIEEQMKGKVIV
jgi:DnaJ-domain-containing protein 1